MKAFWRQFSPPGVGEAAAGLAAIAAAMLSALHPQSFGLLPASPDGLLHLYRLVALDHAIQQGDLWPRYVPGLIFGYGAPVFNYYAPLSLYPLEALHLLGLRFVDALLVGMMLAAVFGALGAWALGRAWGGPAAGLISAVAYGYAPYILYDWPRRGAVAEFAALAILPWLLWSFWRLAERGRRRDLWLAALALAALILTHNITALYTMPLLLIYGAYLWWHAPDPRRAFVRLGLAALVGIGLTTFFWLPALAESRYVHIERVTYAVSNLDFHTNFQSLPETFSPPLTADLTQLHPPVPRPLGWPQIALALAGGALLVTRAGRNQDEHRRLRGWLLLSAGLIIGLIALTTRASTPIWETLPLMHYLQFPWRLLGPASLLLALMAGIGAAQVARRILWAPGQMAWMGLCAALLIGYALPWLYGAYLPDPPAQGIVDAQNFERETGWLAGTAAGEYVPIWTTDLPDPDRLLGLYAQGDVIPRLQPSPDVTVRAASWQAMGAALRIEALRDTRLTFDWLYFPGWWARIDGEPAPIVITWPTGLIGLHVPAGAHDLELGFGPTPLRLGALIASGVFLALLAALTVFFRRLRGPGESIQHAQSPPGRPAALAVLLAGLLALGAKTLLIDHLQTPIKRARFAQGVEAGLQVPSGARFDRSITLLGYDLSPSAPASGGAARLALYWQLTGPPVVEDYSSVIYLRDAVGNIVLQTGSQHPGDYPTTDWLPGLYVQERLRLTIPPGTPPGQYTIHAALYSHTAARNLDAFDAAGNPTGVTAPIGVLEVVRGRPIRVPPPEGAVIRDASPTPELTLLWAGPLPASIEVGQPLGLVWAWRARAAPSQAYTARVVWMVGAGEVAAAAPPLPLTAGYPTDRWLPRDAWRGLHVIAVPGRLEDGEYQVGVQLLDAAGSPVGDKVILGPMTVTAPPRVFDLPREMVPADGRWQNGIDLAGYRLPRSRLNAGDVLELSLYWRPAGEVADSLTVFVHLVDESGVIVAQQDQIPVRGARPTTGWAPGEVIEDAYQLLIPPDAPAGRYRLRIGWYQASSGMRAALPDGSEFWQAPAVIDVRRGP